MGSFFIYQHYSVTTILQVVTPISILKNVIFSSSLQYRFSKIIPSFFTIKEGSTSHPDPLQWSLHPLRFPRFRGTETSGEREETALQCYICPTCPSPAGGSLTHSQALALSKRARDVTALWCSEPLRSKVGGPSKVFAMLCGMGPPYYSLQRLGTAVYSLQLIVYCLQLIL